MSTINVAEPLQERFTALAAEWKSRTRHLSNVAQISLLSPYQQIIGMGPRACPSSWQNFNEKRTTGSGHSRQSQARTPCRTPIWATWLHPQKLGPIGEKRTVF